MPGPSVTIVDSGGLAVTPVDSGAAPFTVVDAGGIAVTIVESGGLPVILEGYSPAPPPSWSVQPSISGTPQVGQTLNGSDGTVVDGTVTARAWLRNGTPIGGATSSTYLLDPADEGATITFRVTASGAGGSAQATSTGVGPVTPALNNILLLDNGDFLLDDATNYLEAA